MGWVDFLSEQVNLVESRHLNEYNESDLHGAPSSGGGKE